MQFESGDAEARINSELIRFADIAEHTFVVSTGLYEKGLRLLASDFGGVVQNSDGMQDASHERFEIELLKERYGSWTIFSHEELRCLGYKSEFLDRLLNNAAIPRDLLDNLSRPTSVDARIDAEPWGWRYRREALERWRSTAQRKVITEEKHREFQKLDLVQSTDVMRTRQRLERFVAEEFGALGYKRTGKKYDKFKAPVYSNETRISRGAALEFMVEIEVTPLMVLPVSLNLRIMPILNLTGSDALLVRCMQRGDFFKPIEPLVPNFGVYRVAWDLEQLELMLYAYRSFLQTYMPFIENVCNQLRD